MHLKRTLLYILLLMPILSGCQHTILRAYELVPAEGASREFSDGTIVQTFIRGAFPSPSGSESREPYHFLIQLIGKIEQIESIQGWLLLNGSVRIPLSQDAEAVNATRSEQSGGIAYFAAGGETFAVAERWEAIRSLELEIHIVAETESGSQRYDARFRYDKRLREEKGSVWDAMMGI